MVGSAVPRHAHDDRGYGFGGGYRGRPRPLGRHEPGTFERRGAADGKALCVPPEPLVPRRPRQTRRALGHARGSANHVAARGYPTPWRAAVLSRRSVLRIGEGFKPFPTCVVTLSRCWVRVWPVSFRVRYSGKG